MFSRYSSSVDQLVSSFLRNYYLCRFLYFSVEIGRNKKIFSTFFWNWRTREKEKMELESDNLEEKIREDNTEMNWGRFFLERWHANIYLLFSLSTKLQLLCYYSISREHILYYCMWHTVYYREVSQWFFYETKYGFS